METNAATERQLCFVRTLVREREIPVAGKSPAEALLIARAEDASEAEQTRFLGRKEASQLIDWLLRQPKRPAPDQPEIGIYVLPDGTIVQAKLNKAKTNVYTKHWIEIRGERLVDATEEHVHGEWEYDPGLKRQLDTARVMTLAEAKDFILRYGQCVRCGRRLKAAQSVERGIGPVCINYFEQFAA
jgi:Family of unknown function (DUF6011)